VIDFQSHSPTFFVSNLIFLLVLQPPSSKVMLSHDNFTWTCKATLEHIRETGVGCGSDEALVSFLPLSSSIAARLLDLHMPMVMHGVRAFRAPPATDAIEPPELEIDQ
jgi:hypothetical protein